MDIKAIAAGMIIYVKEQMYISEGNVIFSGSDEQIYRPNIEIPKFIEPNTPLKPAYRFINPLCEAFARDQGVIFSDQIIGNKTVLLNGNKHVLFNNPISAGRSGAYISNGLIHNGYIYNQGIEHFLNVCYIAAWLIGHGIPCIVNHRTGADIVAQFEDGLCAFEYQTGRGNNSYKYLNEKRQDCISKYGRLYFIGDGISIKEMMQSFNDTKYIIARGKQLKNLLKDLGKLTNNVVNINEGTNRYKEYMVSELWRTRSREYREKQNGICESCHKDVGVENLDTHHVRYAHNLIRDDTERNWRALCFKCHDEQYPKRKRNTI